MPANLNKIKSYVGFAIKSNKIIIGVDNILKKRSKLVILSQNIAENSKRKCFDFARDNNIDVKVVSDDDIAFITNNFSIKALAILDENLAKAIIDNI